MSTGVRSTPCVGICSTTYGDLICRGCKRFAHEIVAWNSYTEDQRDRVWHRLYALRDQATALFVAVSDARLLRDAGVAARLVRPTDMSLLTLSYELLRRRARDLESLDEIGLRALREDTAQPIAVRDAIDSEFHLRSIAHFERSFHTPIDS
jgi:hypothetical protein